MSESSEEKTNRKLSKYIENKYFQFEYSIFPQVQGLMYETGKELATTLVLEYSARIKRLLRKNTDHAFMVRWRRNQRIYNYPDIGDKSLDQIYMMIHSPIRLDELFQFCEISGELNCLDRPSTSFKKQRAKERIKTKKKLIGKSLARTDVNEILSRKIKLYTLVNKDKLKSEM